MSSLPITVAIVGLSAQAKTSWAADGHLTYLLSERGRSNYRIGALLNTSVAAAEAARDHFNLPPSVKAYGSAQDLADDASIDLVVVNTRVDVHYPVAAPSLAAGKALFIEWPITEDHASTEKLLALTKNNKHGLSRSIVGLQNRFGAPIEQLRSILASGRIGRVLSSEVRAFGSLTARNAYSEGLAYFTDRKVGGFPARITFAHMLDYVHSVLGEFVSDGEGFVSRAQIQRPQVDILGTREDGEETAEKGKVGDIFEKKEQVVLRTVTSDAPDLVTLAGSLQPGSALDERVPVAPGATLIVSFRNGPAFPGTPNMLWTINGEKGELRFTSPAGSFMQWTEADEPPVIEVHDHSTDQVEQVKWDWYDWQKDLLLRGRSTAVLYDRYAAAARDWDAFERKRDGKTGRLPSDVKWSTLEDGRFRSKEFDVLFKSWDEQRESEKL